MLSGQWERAKEQKSLIRAGSNHRPRKTGKLVVSKNNLAKIFADPDLSKMFSDIITVRFSYLFEDKAIFCKILVPTKKNGF